VRRYLASVACALAGGFILLSSCANQGEGQRCERLAANLGNDDCESGLVCTPNDQLRWPVQTDGGVLQTPQTYICCPPDRSLAKTAVCANFMPPLGSDASIPEGGGSDAPSDAPAETSSDAPSDSPSEATDAPADATGD
jgi:hypothetical protein